MHIHKRIKNLLAKSPLPRITWKQGNRYLERKNETIILLSPTSHLLEGALLAQSHGHEAYLEWLLARVRHDWPNPSQESLLILNESLIDR